MLLTLALALLAVDPSFYVEPDDTGLRPMHAEFFAAADKVVVHDWRFESDVTAEFATYSAVTDTLTIAPGYDCTDIVRVVAGLPATKEESACHDDNGLSCQGETTFLADYDYEAPYVFTPDADVGVFWSPPFWFGHATLPMFALGSLGVTSLWEVFWLLSMGVLVYFTFGRRRAHMSEPVAPRAPDGLLDTAMTFVFGRSWRTGVSGFAGVSLTVVAAVATVEAPYTFQKLAPLLPGLVASLGLMVAKDGKVSHTQTTK